MAVCADGWIDGWMDGQMGGWNKRQVEQIRSEERYRSGQRERKQVRRSFLFYEERLKGIC